MRKWLIGLGVVLAIVLVLCFLLVFDVYLSPMQETSKVDLLPFDNDVVSFVGGGDRPCMTLSVVIKNKKDFPVDLGGWKVGYEVGKDFYHIPAKTIVAPGDSIIVLSGAGKDDAHHFYTGFSEGGFYINGLQVVSPKNHSSWSMNCNWK